MGNYLRASVINNRTNRLMKKYEKYPHQLTYDELELAKAIKDQMAKEKEA